MPSSKKKKQQAKRGAAAGGKPRSNDDIVGSRIDPNRPPKKAVVRELCDAVLYEANSEARAALIAKVAALEKDGEKAGDAGDKNEIEADKNETEARMAEQPPDATNQLVPITYETKEMMDYPGRCMLTVGRNAPFRVQKVVHGRPIQVMQHFSQQRDQVELAKAQRWTGQEPVVHVLFPQLRLCGFDSIVFLGECYLDKEDIAHFAGRFRKGAGGSRYNWPSSMAVLQCPFTCTMAVPEKDKASGPKKRYVMLLQNIKQLSIVGGGVHMPHRGLPRLCDKEHFAKNLHGEASDADPPPAWCQYPQILEEGIAFRAARKVLPASTAALVTSSDQYLPSAYTLFNFYHESGMCAAVSEAIDAKQGQMMRNLNLGNR